MRNRKPNRVPGFNYSTAGFYFITISVKYRFHAFGDVHKIKPLHEIIGAFKTTSSRQIHVAGYNEFKWQRSFYDTIIRNDRHLYNIRNYIKYNPSRYIKNDTGIEKYHKNNY